MTELEEPDNKPTALPTLESGPRLGGATDL
jgi:hypothetical protein